MRIIKPSAEILKQGGLTPYQFIENIARTCYKSEEYITETSAEKMIKNLVDRKHYAMLEHYTLYFEMSESFIGEFLIDMTYEEIQLNYFNVTHTGDINILSGSFRSFLDLFNLLDSMSECVKRPYSPIPFMAKRLSLVYPLIFDSIKEIGDLEVDSDAHDVSDCVLLSREEFINKYKDYGYIISKHLTHSIKFICDRGVSHEFVRHRVASFAQESTRYCNYSKDKFGNEITVIEPCFWKSKPEAYNVWKNICQDCETVYFNLLRSGATPQEARVVLPNSLKTEIVVTATEKEWQHIVNLRYLGTTGTPHPQMKEVMSLTMLDLMVESECRINYEEV